MPSIGDIKRGSEIGKSSSMCWTKYIWHSCEKCGKERWANVIVSTRTPKHLLCSSCNSHINNPKGSHSGEKHWSWQGGRFVNTAGYVFVKCPPEFSSMSNVCGYVFEHRLVIAKSLERTLGAKEMVHHINGDKKDNRLENLKLVKGIKEHFVAVLEENKQLRQLVKELENKLTQLEAEEAM